MVNFELCNEISQELCILSCLDDWEMKENSTVLIRDLEPKTLRFDYLLPCMHALSINQENSLMIRDTVFINSH